MYVNILTKYVNILTPHTKCNANIKLIEKIQQKKNIYI